MVVAAVNEVQSQYGLRTNEYTRVIWAQVAVFKVRKTSHPMPIGAGRTNNCVVRIVVDADEAGEGNIFSRLTRGAQTRILLLAHPGRLCWRE